MKAVPTIKIIAVLISFFLIACSSKQIDKSKEAKFDIYFGRTGGFTNEKTVYLINEKGEVFKIKNAEREKIRQISPEQSKALLKALNDMNFKEQKLSDPGNMTYFIEVQSAEYKNKVQWNDRGDYEKFKAVYKKLIEELK